MNSTRDTQFTGFAKLLLSEMVKLHGYIDISVLWNDINDETSQEYIQIIARRAYDLVQHTIGYSLEYLHETGRETPGSMGKRIAPTIPDITNWPENSHESHV